MDILQQVAVYFLRLVDEVGVGVYLFTFLKQDFPIGAFAAANEENEIVCCRKFTDVRHTVGYLPANGVEVFKGARVCRTRNLQNLQIRLMHYVINGRDNIIG